MNTWLHHIWERLRTSYWFVPGVMVFLLSLAALLSLWIDDVYGEKLLEVMPSLRQVSPDGMRTLLSTIATSLLTLVGVTFSGTLVALTMASGQFGSRLLRNFIRQPVNQITLGFLLGNFFMCLFVIRHVRGGGDATEVPHVAGLVALLTTVASLGLFIYFIHRLASSLQADNVVRDVYLELDHMVEDYFPDEKGCGEEDAEVDKERDQWEEKREGEVALNSEKVGYLQVVNVENLIEIAREEELRVRAMMRPGQFVDMGTTMAMIEREKIDEALSKRVAACFIIGGIRNADQDIEFCLGQLVEVALRALSPGINDPFTAITCVDYIGAAMSKISARALPKREFKNEAEKVCVRTRPTSFAAILETAFLQLRQTVVDRPDLSIRLVQTLEKIGKTACTRGRQNLLLEHAEHLVKAAADRFAEPDKKALTVALDRMRETLNNDD